MPIEQQLDDTLKQAMRNKDQPTLDVVRMLKARLGERRTAKGFSGEVDDALVREVIGAYRRQMQKAVEEYGKLGDKGAAQVEKLRFEIDFCGRFLPATMSDAELRELLRERLARLGVSDPKQVGRVVGDVMKSHKGRVEAADVKRVAEELLAGG